MNALVTGGMGFIGSHVVDLLVQKNIDVVVVDNLSTGQEQNRNAKAKYIIEDVLRVSQSRLKEFDYIFHMAALPRIQPSFDEPMLHETANVVTAVHLMENLKDNKRLKKLVFSSSSSVYGNPEEFPTTERAPIDPLSPYALQKYAAERYCLLLGERWNIPAVALRYFNVYGPRSFNEKNPQNAYSSVVGIFANQHKKGQTLTVVGDGSQERDFVHVRDVAAANWLAAASPGAVFDVFNVGAGSKISIVDLAKRFTKNYKFIPDRKGEAKVTWANIDKIAKAINWKPSITLDEGIEELLGAERQGV